MSDPGPRTARLNLPQHSAPANELPAVLATPGLVWRGEGIAFAIPSLHVYSAGAEMLTLCRMKEKRARGDIAGIKAIMTALEGLTANGLPLHPQSGQYGDHGFTYRHWVILEPEGLNGDLAFALDWPGVPAQEHRIPAARINSAMLDVVTLWSPGPDYG